MPKVQRIRLLGGPKEGEPAGKGKQTMESYMGSSLCLVCRKKLPPIRSGADTSRLPLCKTCKEVKTQDTLLALQRKLEKAERKARDMEDVCRSCANVPWDEEVRCNSRDCPVYEQQL